MMTMGNPHEELPRKVSRSISQASVKLKISSPLSYLEAMSHEQWQRGPGQKYSFLKGMSLSQQTDSDLP